ncbi:MAG TPA: phospholipase D-like domain-containing protein [Nannocystaceae bacterium]|nr:phospholipase D-like domain-containing protein [Nannocystaceae bacterium]
MRRVMLGLVGLLSCNDGGGAAERGQAPSGKADGFADERTIEVLRTEPHCDVCSSADKTDLLARAPIVARLVELIDGAQERIDIAQFTFSDKRLEAAIVRAHDRGVHVRLAMNEAQGMGDTVTTRLRDAGLDVELVAGKGSGSTPGLLHAKFMLVDGTTLAMGSNNWSSTGLSINEENTIVIGSAADDPLLAAFACDFEAIFHHEPDDAAKCATEEAKFTPSGDPVRLIRDELRGAQTSIDVLMHHFLFADLVTELAKAAERGVKVRVIVNAADRAEPKGAKWDRLVAAGGELRFKQTNADLFQIMHDKLVVVDDRVLVVGSGNWSGSAFFNNFEFYVRLDRADAVTPFVDTFARLWQWSLTGASLDAGITAAEQDANATTVFYGNLHAHHQAADGAHKLDDGKLQREVDGTLVDVSSEVDGPDVARFAFEYARDVGGLDFLAMTPHVSDERAEDPADLANMSAAGYDALVATARRVTEDSAGGFVALAGGEWSTSSTGNHLGVLGISELPKVTRGRFDQLYREYGPARVAAGDRPILFFAHPRTFRRQDESLAGEWDQIFGHSLLDIAKASERNVKFNDFGLDDYAPLAEVRAKWLDGSVMPDEQTVIDTLDNLRTDAQPFAKLIEVTVNRGAELASAVPVNPSLTPLEDGTIERFVKTDDWFYYLGHGFRLAPIASHDNHFANWGTGHTSRTAILARALESDALLDALHGMAVYASEDENLELRVYADGRVRAGQAMTTVAEGIELSLRLSDPDFAGPYAVSVLVSSVGGGAPEIVLTEELAGDAWQKLAVPLPSKGDHFVVVQVHEVAPDRMAWSAPVFVHR